VAEIILHVGAHKTGTSLVQKFLRDQPAQVAPLGIRSIGRGDSDQLIGWGGIVVDSPGRLRERLEAEVAGPGARFVVVSHENTLGKPIQRGGGHLYPEAPRKIVGLAAAVEGFEVRVVYYLRSQAAFLESYYLHLIQIGEFFGFEEWLDRVDLEAVSWAPVVEGLVEAFGEDRVAVGDFEEIRLGQEEFLRRFFLRVDPGLEVSPQYGAKRNFSIGEKGMHLALAINPHLRTPEERRATRKFLQRYFSNADHPRPRLFTDEQKAWLENRYHTENQHLHQPA
jgi:hypothetical protein